MRDVLAFCVLMACLSVLVASLIALVKPLPRFRLTTRKRAVSGVGVALGLFVLTAFIMPTPQTDGERAGDKTPTHPNTLAASDSQISEARFFEQTKFGNIKVDLGGMWDDDDLPVHAAIVLEAAGKAMKVGVSDMPASIETLYFWFTAPILDQTGGQSRAKVLEFRVKVADLKAMDYDAIAPQNMLELASDVWVKLAARKGVAEYCRSNAATNPRFCASAI